MRRHANRSWGMIVLAVYVIAEGLVHLGNLAFSGMNIVLGVLAVAAGVLLLVGR